MIKYEAVNRAILKDGHHMDDDDIAKELNRKSYLEGVLSQENMLQRAQYKALLQRCRDAICEAGYEDYDMNLMSELEKAI